MALIVTTKKPERLVASVYAAVRTAPTWHLDQANPALFFHATASRQYEERLRIRPRTTETRAIFNVEHAERDSVTLREFAVIQGRFLALLVSHVLRARETVSVTSVPYYGDWRIRG